MIAPMKDGVVTQISKQITMHSIKHQTKSIRFIGIIWSMVSRSDVNLFRTRPVELEGLHKFN